MDPMQEITTTSREMGGQGVWQAPRYTAMIIYLETFLLIEMFMSWLIHEDHDQMIMNVLLLGFHFWGLIGIWFFV